MSILSPLKTDKSREKRFDCSGPSSKAQSPKRSKQYFWQHDEALTRELLQRSQKKIPITSFRKQGHTRRLYYSNQSVECIRRTKQKPKDLSSKTRRSTSPGTARHLQLLCHLTPPLCLCPASLGQLQLLATAEGRGGAELLGQALQTSDGLRLSQQRHAKKQEKTLRCCCMWFKTLPKRITIQIFGYYADVACGSVLPLQLGLRANQDESLVPNTKHPTQSIVSFPGLIRKKVSPSNVAALLAMLATVSPHAHSEAGRPGRSDMAMGQTP